MPGRAVDGGDGSPASWFGLAGKVVVVAGAGGGGIGTGIASLAARAGASVVGLDNRPEALRILDAALAGTPGPHRSLAVDLRHPSEVEEAVAEADDLGPLHGLVHVAGGMWPEQWATVLDTDLAVFDQVVDLNLRTALTTLRAVGSRLVANGAGGSMVTIASIVGQSAMPYGTAYAAAKAALLSVTRTAALELGPRGVRVNAVAVGTVRTPKNADDRAGGLPEETPAERVAIPLGRWGKPEDIAGGVLYLLSDLSTWTTGQTLAIDGGSSTRPSLLDADNLPVFVQSTKIRDRLLERGS